MKNYIKKKDKVWKHFLLDILLSLAFAVILIGNFVYSNGKDFSTWHYAGVTLLILATLHAMALLVLSIFRFLNRQYFVGAFYILHMAVIVFCIHSGFIMLIISSKPTIGHTW